MGYIQGTLSFSSLVDMYLGDFFVILFHFVFRDRVSLSRIRGPEFNSQQPHDGSQLSIRSTGCPEVQSIDQAGLELTEIRLPLPPTCCRHLVGCFTF